MNPSIPLLSAGALMSAGYLFFGTLQPLRAHVGSFLIVFALLFILWLFSIHWVEIFAGNFGGRRGPSEGLPWRAFWHRTFGKGQLVSPDSPGWEKGVRLLILLFALLFRIVMLGSSPSLSDDIYRYAWDGRVQNAGINPYLYPPRAEQLSELRDEDHALINHPGIRTLYPPLAQWAFRLADRIDSGINAQRGVFVLFDMGIIFLLFGLLKRRRQSPARALIYAWNPLVIVEYAGSGHLDSMMLFFLLGGLFFFERARMIKGAIGVGLAILSKWIPFVMLPWLLVKRKGRALGLLFVILLAGYIPFFKGFNEMVSVSFLFKGVQTYSKDWVFNPSLYGILSLIIGHPAVIKIGFGLLLIAFSFYWACRQRNNPLLYVFGCLYALLLASPVVHPWYVTWLLPFLCFYPLRSGLLWTGVVALTYTVLIRYDATGVWNLSPWIMILEYTPVYGLLGWELLRAGSWQAEKGIEKSPIDKFPNAMPLSASRLPRLNVSVIIPVLNEEKAIRAVVQEIPKHCVAEIIVVDNGSTDRTAEIARSSGAKVVHEPVRGYGRSVLKGLAQIDEKCDTVVVLDGDHSDFPEELPRLLAPLERGEADLVIGNRLVAAAPGALMPHQRFGNWITCRLIHVLTGHTFCDLGPFRVIRRAALERLNMKDASFGWNVEMQVKAIRNGLTIREVPVRYRPRIGKSKISGTVKGTVQAGTTILWSVFRYSLRN